ncbi:MAG TPA: CAP domain-containing protein [Solirubrobacteraceae bacterium]
MAVTAALAAIPAGAGASSSCPGANLRPTGVNAAAIDAATLCLIAQIRLAHRLPPLRSNATLGTVAASQVSSMVRRNYFADVRPTGQTPMSLVGITTYKAHSAKIAVGQNIAWGNGGLASPARIVAAWMASPPHRAIMLSREYRDAGAGVTPQLPSVLHAGRHGAVYAIEFGARV